MTPAVARFRSRARIVAGSFLLLLAVVIVSVTVATAPGDDAPQRTVIAVTLGALLLLAGLAGGPVFRSVALRALRRRFPEAFVFLARREPVLAPDIQTYQYRKDNFADVADKWVPAVVDSRGIAIFSAGFRPRELLIMEWSELGTISAGHFSSISGRRRYGVAVDVRPFSLPLLVRVGHSEYGVEGSFDSDGVDAAAEAVKALRP